MFTKLNCVENINPPNLKKTRFWRFTDLPFKLSEMNLTSYASILAQDN